MIRKIHFNTEAREKLKNGVDQLANAVKVTLGPKGRNVVIDYNDYIDPHVTKDGVTVAQTIFLEDRVENIGAQLVKSVAKRTAEYAGDGTTTATVLAQAIFHAGIKNLAAGANPMDLKRGIDKAVALIVEDLKKQSKKISGSEQIAQIGTISANNDSDIGKMIAEAMEKVGEDGLITIEESQTTDTHIRKVEGMELDRGFLSPYFVTNRDRMEVQMDNPFILLFDKKINVFHPLIPIMEKVMQTGRPLLVIAEDVEGEALASLVINTRNNSFKVAAIKAPEFGDRKKAYLEDIASLTGGQVISEDKGHKLENVELEELGVAEKINVNSHRTIIIGGAGDQKEIKDRIEAVKSELKHAPNDYERVKTKERLAKLIGGVAILYVGAPTETEMKEKKDRVDDALNATKAAVEEGIVAGGGVALIRCLKVIENVEVDNEDQQTGVEIIRKAIQSPFKTIVENTGKESAAFVAQIVNSKDPKIGYDARQDKIVNMFTEGIIDPTKVTRLALENAASIAGLILTTECVIVDVPLEDQMKLAAPPQYQNPQM